MGAQSQSTLTIGQVSVRAGIGIDTIRYYEKQGLLQKPARRESGYREYSAEVIARLHFIKRAQELGFSLREIEELLGLRFNPKSTCGDVRTRAESKILDISAKIRDLQRMKKSLQKLTNVCRGKGPVNECPILESFEQEAK